MSQEFMETSRLFDSDFPKASEYPEEWVMDNSMGPNVLWLTDWLCRDVELSSGMRVLDLGCGKALSSIFLAREFEVEVWAVDLWDKPHENLRRVREWGVDKLVFPMQADVRNLPFAHDFFDAIICVDSYMYYGTDQLYLNYLLRFLRKGGTLGFSLPGLMRELPDGKVPEHLKPFWAQECWGIQTIGWWNGLWEKTGLVDIKIADTLPDGGAKYLRWKRCLKSAGKCRWPEDIEILEKDDGRYLGLIRMIAEKRETPRYEY